MLPGPLQVGDLLAGRYRLLDPVASGSSAALWRATDEVLARDVAVRALPATNKAGRAEAEQFLEAAARTGKVSHPGLVRVYDAALDERPGRAADIAYLIREWVDGEPLDEHLERVGELAGPDAADVLRQVADALTAAHRAGLAHGRVHPGNVLITREGRVRLTDALVAASVHGDPVPDPVDDITIWRDTRDAAAVLYALLTTHWPAGSTPQPPGSLPASPLTHGHAVGAHQLRAGVPLRLDHVVERALDPSRVPTLPPLRTPAALADAADSAVAESREQRARETAPPREPGWVRRHIWWFAAAAVVVAFGLGGWFAGLSVGALPRRPDAVDALLLTPTAEPSHASPVPAAIDLTKVGVRDFDPQGNRQENPDQVKNATDGYQSTAWFTSTYGSATFGGLKRGVGLVLDLGAVRSVSSVKVAFTAPGAHVELHVADSAPATIDQTALAATDDKGDQVATLTPVPGSKARYLIIWITLLPKQGSGYRVGIEELRVT